MKRGSGCAIVAAFTHQEPRPPRMASLRLSLASPSFRLQNEPQSEAWPVLQPASVDQGLGEGESARGSGHSRTSSHHEAGTLVWLAIPQDGGEMV